MLKTFLFGGDIFSQRISRKTWWSGFVIALIIKTILPMFFTFYSITKDFNLNTISLVVIMTDILALFILTFYTVKRLHDRNKDTKYILLLLVPYLIISVPTWLYFVDFVSVPSFISSISIVPLLWILIECAFLKGTTGPNRFGPDPLALPEQSGSSAVTAVVSIEPN